MSGAVLHADGKHRCPWPKQDNPLYVDYHDDEWGVPEYDDRALYEKLVLDGFQAGLSWITILRKRDNFRRAFDGFDPQKIARYDARKKAKLMADAGIVRNRLKVDGAVLSARAYLDVMEKGPGFSAFLWDFLDGKPKINKFRDTKQVPAETALSQKMSKELCGARLQVRRPDHRLCLHAGGRHGQRPSGRMSLLQALGRRERPQITTKLYAAGTPMPRPQDILFGILGLVLVALMAFHIEVVVLALLGRVCLRLDLRVRRDDTVTGRELLAPAVHHRFSLGRHVIARLDTARHVRRACGSPGCSEGGDCHRRPASCWLQSVLRSSGRRASCKAFCVASDTVRSAPRCPASRHPLPTLPSRGTKKESRAWQRMLSGRRLDLLDPSPLDVEIGRHRPRARPRRALERPDRGRAHLLGRPAHAAGGRRGAGALAEPRPQGAA